MYDHQINKENVLQSNFIDHWKYMDNFLASASVSIAVITATRFTNVFK